MLKKITISFLVLALLLSVSCSKDAENSITVYAYDSFCSSWGAGPDLVKDFEEETSIHVNLVSCGSGPEMYSRVILEGKACKADVVLGISDTQNIDRSIFESFTPSCKDNLIKYDPALNVVPFDWGIIAFNQTEDSEYRVDCLDDLLKPDLKGKFILIDPRTSSVGLSTLLWTIDSMGLENALLWWKQACKNALTVASSWSMAYGLFTEKEAPLVVSYSTSPVYHKLNGEDFSTKALPFKEGNFRTVEYLGILKTSKSKEKAKQFCDYILTKGQNTICISNTMLPANTKTELPEAFSDSANFVIYDVSSVFNGEQINFYLDRWTEVISAE